MDRKTAIERKLLRQYGPSAEAKEKLSSRMEEFDDWKGRCRKCGSPLQGPLRKLRAHCCGK